MPHTIPTISLLSQKCSWSLVPILNEAYSTSYFTFFKRNEDYIKEFLWFYREQGDFKIEHATTHIKNTVANHQQYLQGDIKHPTTLNFLISKRLNIEQDDDVIGIIGFLRMNEGDGEIGYLLDKEYQGKGIISISAEHLINNTLPNYVSPKYKVKLICHPDNKKSIAIADRLKFSLANPQPTRESVDPSKYTVVYERNIV